jgi:hypothetical protein
MVDDQLAKLHLVYAFEPFAFVHNLLYMIRAGGKGNRTCFKERSRMPGNGHCCICHSALRNWLGGLRDMCTQLRCTCASRLAKGTDVWVGALVSISSTDGESTPLIV